MGLINFAMPEKETEYLIESMVLNVFLEGGMYNYATIKSMSEKFRKVYTVKKSDVMLDIAKENLKGIKVALVGLLKGKII